MTNLVTTLSHSISTWGYLAIFVLMLLDNLAIPIPSEITLAFGGYMAYQGQLGLLGVIGWGTFGSVVGSFALYGIGAFGGYELVKKYGKAFFVNNEHMVKAERFFEKYGNASNFFGRLVPIIRSYISLPAGLYKMRIWPFLIYSFLGSLVWSILLSYAGYKLGGNWQVILKYSKQYDYLVALAAVAIIAWFVFKHFSKKHKA